jgi:hypothetical protein
VSKALFWLALVVAVAPALPADATLPPVPVSTPAPAMPTDDSMWVKLDSITSTSTYQCIKVRNDTVFCALQAGTVDLRDRLTGAIISSVALQSGSSVIAVCPFADSICVSRLSAPEHCEVYTLGGTYVRSFSPSGGQQVRGLDWDGAKFWATSFSSPNLTIYTMDRNGTVLRTLSQAGGVVSPTIARDLVLDPMYENRLWSMPHAGGGAYQLHVRHRILQRPG